MSLDSDTEADILENVDELMDGLLVRKETC